MNSKWTLAMAAVAALGLILSVPATGMADKGKDGGKVTLDQVPAAVKATITKEAGKNEIKEIEKKTKGEKTIYEAEWVADGKEVEIKVSAEGKLLAKELQVTMEQLPEAVRKAVQKEAGDNKVEKVAKHLKDGKVTYEAQWKADGKEVEVKFAEDGTVLKKEAKDAGKEDEGQKDKD